MADMQRIFAEWPNAIPRKATVVTSFGDAIPFADYMMNGELLLLIRAQPDAQGTRRAIVSTKDIVALRFQDPIEAERFMSMGFQQPQKSLAAGIR